MRGDFSVCSGRALGRPEPFERWSVGGSEEERAPEEDGARATAASPAGRGPSSRRALGDRSSWSRRACRGRLPYRRPRRRVAVPPAGQGSLPGGSRGRNACRRNGASAGRAARDRAGAQGRRRYRLAVVGRRRMAPGGTHATTPSGCNTAGDATPTRRRASGEGGRSRVTPRPTPGHAAERACPPAWPRAAPAWRSGGATHKAAGELSPGGCGAAGVQRQGAAM